MRKIIFVIALCTFVFSQVPDSVVVNKLVKNKVEFNENKVIIKKYQVRQEYLRISHEVLSELIKEKVQIKEEEKR